MCERVVSKYSTNGGLSTADDTPATSCDLCGESDGNLQTATVAGAQVTVCNSCHPNGESQNEDDNTETDVQSTPDSAEREISVGFTLARTDSDWVEESRPEYQNTNQPYLLPEYASNFNTRVDELDVPHSSLAEDCDVPLWVFKALSNNNAIIEGVTRQHVTEVEELLGVRLQETADEDDEHRPD